MPKQIRITIPEPCRQEWSKMTPTQQGTFCSVCQKKVIDFSVKTENEIYEILINSTGKVCGRFTEMQLQQPVRKTEINNGVLNWRAIVTGLAALFCFNRVSANNDLETKPRVVVADTIIADDSLKQEITTNPVTISNPITTNENGFCIQGKVINMETNLPVQFATLQFGNSEIGTTTDICGNFSLHIDSVTANRYGSVITVRAFGYETRQIHMAEFWDKKNVTVKLILENDIAIVNTSAALGLVTTCTVLGGIGYTQVKETSREDYWILNDLLFNIRARVSNGIKFNNRE